VVQVSDAAVPDGGENAALERRSIPGDRGVAVVARSFASMQAKVRNALALAVVGLLGGGFLAWYYSGLAESRAEAKQVAPPAQVEAESVLPPLGPAPTPAKPKATEPTVLIEEGSAEAQALLGPQEPPTTTPLGAYGNYGYTPPAATPQVEAVTSRRLESPVLVRGSGSFGDGGDTGTETEFAAAPSAAPASAAGSGTTATGLGALLTPTRTAAVAAGVLPERRWLLAKGASLDCTLETAIDSTLPGMTSCVLATDAWSADGSVVLMERGTKLIGETRGGVRQGEKRLFVLWNEARTPRGVAVELASPGTDALGRAGVTGDVDTQFGTRFGAAILISLLDAAAAAVVAAQGEGGNNVVVSTRGAQDVVSEIVRGSMDVAPVIRVPQGERIAVLVARDVDFAGVYALAGS